MPGKNEKHYLAGALHAKTGKVIYVSGTKKDSNLFIAMLEKLKRHYRRAKIIILVLDNYVIQENRKTNVWLAANPKFVLLFQPVYCPWVNVIERLWHALHETFTRNHQCKYMYQLLTQVKHFMATASPYPDSGHGMAKRLTIRISYLDTQPCQVLKLIIPFYYALLRALTFKALFS